ncbi:MAG: hypothetical protein IJD94_05565 [Clostridia bacterium]|nr:hypothetical protein [Clostridia bacterium]
MGWQLVRYQTSAGTRTGYVHRSEILDPPYLGKAPDQQWRVARVARDCMFTDDTSSIGKNSICRVYKDTYVICLGEYNNSWAYVEGMLNDQLIRGFIPLSCLY